MSVADKTELGYTLKANNKEVLIEADYYVPFEPKKANVKIRDKVIELQNVIKQSIKELVVEDEEILFAAYSENDKNRFYDVENMLFFNIGTSTFSNCCKNQIAFVGDEERFVAMDTHHTDTEERYFYSYRVLKVKEVESLLADKKVIASWNEISIDTKIPQSATRYYATIRENATNITVKEALTDKCLFGMKLDLTLPFKSLPASVMKPLLDGIICAFHGEENKAIETINMMFGNTVQFVNEASKKLNIFGNREYVSPYRGENSYKWNPEDERLQFAWITVHLGKEAMISGEIYKWN